MNRRDLFKFVPATLLGGVCLAEEKTEKFVPAPISKGNPGAIAYATILSIRDRLTEEGLCFKEAEYIGTYEDISLYRENLRGVYGMLKNKRTGKKIGFSCDWHVSKNMMPAEVASCIEDMIKKEQA